MKAKWNDEKKIKANKELFLLIINIRGPKGAE